MDNKKLIETLKNLTESGINHPEDKIKECMKAHNLTRTQAIEKLDGERFKKGMERINSK